MIIILIGPPGVGKGTQAKKISDVYNITHLSTGDILRLEIKNRTEEGLRFEKLIAEGSLIDDATMLGIIEKRIGQADCENGFLLDGFPRTIEQAKGLDVLLNKVGKGIDGIVLLVADDSMLIQRISGRFSCKNCGAIYNKYLSPTKEVGVCDECNGTDFVYRADDNEETVKDRLKIYHNQAQDILSHYNKNDLVVRIDGSKSSEEVFKLIKKEIDKLV